MKFDTPLMEIQGITTVWINKISKWQRAQNGWLKTNGGPGFKERGMSHEDFYNMIQNLLYKRFDYSDEDGWSPLMYRGWVSGSTLNIVQRKMINDGKGYFRVE